LKPYDHFTASSEFFPEEIKREKSPCDGCFASCCWIAGLQKMEPENFFQLDFAYYLAGFRHIEIGINRKGIWNVNLRRPCSHLDEAYECRLHENGRKPQVCKEYDEGNCLYREAFLGNGANYYLRLDRRRMEILLGKTALSESGSVIETPAREALEVEFEKIKEYDFDEGMTPFRKGSFGDFGGGRGGNFFEMSENPCLNCPAPCCQLLAFNYGFPDGFSNADFMRYLAGFEGIEFAISDRGYMIIVWTACAHFESESRNCSLHQTARKPNVCRYYNAHDCWYKRNFLTQDTADILILKREETGEILNHFEYDKNGKILYQPRMAQVAAILSELRGARVKEISSDIEKRFIGAGLTRGFPGKNNL